MEKLLYTVAEVEELVGLKKSKLYELMGRGKLASLKIDGSRRIPREALDAFLELYGRAPQA